LGTKTNLQDTKTPRNANQKAVRVSPLLDVRRLEVSYQTAQEPVYAVREISFQITAGEILALVGETGCGKSTLALSLLGLMDRGRRIESGDILFEGLNLRSLGARQWKSIRGRKIGIAFQDPRGALNPVLTVGEHLVESLRAHQDLAKRQAWRKSLELLAEVGFPDPELNMGRYPFQLSGGMCRRLGIALGICNQPALLIADEPTSGLDPSIQAQILALLREMTHRYHLALLLISHDLPMVAGLADRVAVMYHGRLIETGTAADTFDNPAHPYTRALLECLPTLQHRADRGPLPQIFGTPPVSAQEFPGCAFEPRCPLAEERCTRSFPPPRALSETHWAACIKAE
jgi:oligopeptide/dipeptide ABC transporter ATP-binding protein